MNSNSPAYLEFHSPRNVQRIQIIVPATKNCQGSENYWRRKHISIHWTRFHNGAICRIDNAYISWCTCYAHQWSIIILKTKRSSVDWRWNVKPPTQISSFCTNVETIYSFIVTAENNWFAFIRASRFEMWDTWEDVAISLVFPHLQQQKYYCIDWINWYMKTKYIMTCSPEILLSNRTTPVTSMVTTILLEIAHGLEKNGFLKQTRNFIRPSCSKNPTVPPNVVTMIIFSSTNAVA